MIRILLTSLICILLFGCKKQGKVISNNLPFNFEDSIGVNLHYTTIRNSNLDSIIKFINYLSKIKNNSAKSKEALMLIADSIYELKGLKKMNYATNIFDSVYVHPNDILYNEKLAINAFLESNWKDSVCYKDFLEYILPYKLKDEIFDDWRVALYQDHKQLISSHPELKNLDSLYEYHLSNTYYTLSSDRDMNKYLPNGENYRWLNMSREGDCISSCNYVIYHLRAAGAPATFDYIPNWGNRPYAVHAFVGLANRNQQLKRLLANNNNPSNLVDNLNAAQTSKYTHVFNPKDLPQDIYIEYEKTIPKVYRQTWNKQTFTEQLLIESSPSEINQNLVNAYQKDVTAQYMETTTVQIQKNIFEPQSLAYLATFDINGWVPVAYASFNWYGRAVFQDIGKNILYMPMICKYKMEPFGYPFIINDDGKKKLLICNYDKTITMQLKRKFPLFSYTANHVVSFKGCKIEGANDYHFKDAKTLHRIDYYPFGMQVVDFEIPDTVRYVHLISPKEETLRIAEFECFEDSCGIMKKMEDINFKSGELKGNSINAFDGDLNSYLVGKWVRLDFGSPKPVKRIKFCPRNDTNYILPGNEYELFYWDNRWVSAGRQIATDYQLNYKDVPIGTLYWLRCLTQGREERIFTFENNKQIWW